MDRRTRLGALLLMLVSFIPFASGAPTVRYPDVVPGRPVTFPRDAGSHPEFATEWWYVTGWLDRAGAPPLGFQVTFFRVRPGYQEDNPSAFAARQILFAHAALSDPATGRLMHDQRMSRSGPGIAGARTERTDVWLEDWSLRAQTGGYRARVIADGFRYDLLLQTTQTPLAQGDDGFSRKGRRPGSASYYYSEPQLAVSGTVWNGTSASAVTGQAWLDHEWSSAPLEPGAIGWDWTGVNLDGGGALMALRIRAADGSTVWSSATLRSADGAVQRFGPDAVAFAPRRQWRSPRTGVSYPVACDWRVGTATFTLEPMMDDQELDSRLTAGAIYWEGAVRALRGDRPAGRGYLELTGYDRPLRLGPASAGAGR